MIRFTKSEDYAIALVDALSKSYGVSHLPLSKIANDYHLSLLFLRNIANQLKHAGVITAVEGKSGGYTLAKHPNEMSMHEILGLFINDSAFACCDLHKKSGICQRATSCRPLLILRRMNQEFVQKISKLSVTEFQQYAK